MKIEKNFPIPNDSIKSPRSYTCKYAAFQLIDKMEINDSILFHRAESTIIIWLRWLESAARVSEKYDMRNIRDSWKFVYKKVCDWIRFWRVS